MQTLPLSAEPDARRGLDGHTIKRSWNYFIEHLMDADPVMNVKIETRPSSP